MSLYFARVPKYSILFFFLLIDYSNIYIVCIYQWFLHRYHHFQQYSKKPASRITLRTGDRWVHNELIIELLKMKKITHTT